jgi:hypothetical protein
VFSPGRGWFWQVDPGGSMDWTVSQFWNWYQQEQQQQKDQLPDAAYYLTNIQLTDGDLDEWRRGNTVIDALSSCGRYDLMRYIHLWDRDVPIPSMKARGYLVDWHVSTLGWRWIAAVGAYVCIWPWSSIDSCVPRVGTVSVEGIPESVRHV